MCYVYYKKYHRNNFFCVHSVWPWCVLGYVTIMYWVCHHNIRLVSSWYNNCWSITRLLSTSNKNVIRLTFLSEEWTEIANNQKIPVYDFDLFKSTCNFQHDQTKNNNILFALPVYKYMLYFQYHFLMNGSYLFYKKHSLLTRE